LDRKYAAIVWPDRMQGFEHFQARLVQWNFARHFRSSFFLQTDALRLNDTSDHSKLYCSLFRIPVFSATSNSADE